MPDRQLIEALSVWAENEAKSPILYLSNRAFFFRVYIAPSKHEDGWENPRRSRGFA